MFNIVCFIQRLDHMPSVAYNVYQKLYEQKLLSHPIIFTDQNLIQIKYNIPIFPTFYIRNYFYKHHILVDYNNINYLHKYLHYKCIVIYNDKTDDISNINSYLNINIEKDVISTIKESLYEKI